VPFLGSSRFEQRATVALAAAAVIVGASVVTDGTVSKALNGVSGLTWFASSAMFIIEARRRGASSLQWAGIAALTAGVAFVIRPSDLVLAVAGFAPAGFIAGAIGRKDPLLWAKMVPALYLPMHIGTAVLKAVGRSVFGLEASIRTEAPPIAAVVPAVMFGAAMGGGWVASRIQKKRQADVLMSTS
jgi:hypothetical protein